MTEQQAKELIRDGVLKGMCQYHVICFDANAMYWRRYFYYLFNTLVWFFVMGVITIIALTAGYPAIAALTGIAWLGGSWYGNHLLITRPIRMYREDFIKAAKAPKIVFK